MDIQASIVRIESNLPQCDGFGTGFILHRDDRHGGTPLFCSAVVMLIGSVPRVSAIYDPIHHTVYSAILPGPEGNIVAGAEAWYVSTNSRLDLVRLAKMGSAKDLREAAVGIHLNRSHPEKLKAFLGAGQVLVEACGGRVTDFDGNAIDYAAIKPVSLIAAKSHL